MNCDVKRSNFIIRMRNLILIINAGVIIYNLYKFIVITCQGKLCIVLFAPNLYSPHEPYIFSLMLNIIIPHWNDRGESQKKKKEKKRKIFGFLM